MLLIWERHRPSLQKWIKADFEEWSGGFPPESYYQITVYVENTMPADADEAAVRKFILQWMNDPEN